MEKFKVKWRGFQPIAWAIVLALSILFVDFLSKEIVYHLIAPKMHCVSNYFCGIPIFHNFFGIDFSISLTFNRGAAWGLFSDFQFPLLILRIFVVVALVLYLIFFNHKVAPIFPLACILAGAIGNIADYFIFGHVIDFLAFNLWGYSFPIFNIADSAITIGVIWLLLLNLFSSKKIKKSAE